MVIPSVPTGMWWSVYGNPMGAYGHAGVMVRAPCACVSLSLCSLVIVCVFVCFVSVLYPPVRPIASLKVFRSLQTQNFWRKHKSGLKVPRGGGVGPTGVQPPSPKTVYPPLTSVWIPASLDPLSWPKTQIDGGLPNQTGCVVWVSRVLSVYCVVCCVVCLCFVCVVCVVCAGCVGYVRCVLVLVIVRVVCYICALCVLCVRVRCVLRLVCIVYCACVYYVCSA